MPSLPPNTPLWRVETHCHTYRSPDCLTQPAQLLEAARVCGLTKLCITDHNDIRGALELQQLAPDLIIPGVEILTTQGELLAYYVQQPVPAHRSPIETIARLREQGAVISVSHPFDHQRHGWQLADLLAILPLVDAIEVFNARTFNHKHNDQAAALAQTHDICGTVGSDAHSAREVGTAVLLLPPFQGASEFRTALAHADSHRQYAQRRVRLYSRWAVISRKLRLNPDPHKQK